MTITNAITAQSDPCHDCECHGDLCEIKAAWVNHLIDIFEADEGKAVRIAGHLRRAWPAFTTN